jgi:hypothetical protein
MATTVKMNGTQMKREVNVIRKQTIVIKDATGVERKVKLVMKKPDPASLTENDKSLAELNKLFPKPRNSPQVEEYSSASEHSFAKEMKSQIAKFEETNRRGQRGRRNRGWSGHNPNNDWS